MTTSHDVPCDLVRPMGRTRTPPSRLRHAGGRRRRHGARHHRRDRRRRGARGRPSFARPRRRESRSPSCVPPTPSRPSGRVGCASSRSRAARGRLPRARRPASTAWSCRRRRSRCATCVAESWSSTCPTTRPTARGVPAANCEMQGLARQVGVAEVRYGLGGANHLSDRVDTSTLTSAYDPKACIVCSRCVRACSEVQGTFALTVEGRGFDSRVSASGAPNFLESECVSCGACVQACPTDALTEKSVIELGMPTRSVDTTCAYCGVGCSFRAEVQGTGDDTRVVRMMPSKAGGANEGHSCVKGRFAYGYASHRDRQLSPMVRDSIHDDWRIASWDEAIERIAFGFKRHPDPARHRCHRRHLVLALHQRGGLRRPEDGASGFPQQQHRHLRTGVPLPHGLWPEPDVRHVGGHPGLRLRRAV